MRLIKSCTNLSTRLLPILLLLVMMSSCEEDRQLWKAYDEVKFGAVYHKNEVTRNLLFQFNDEAIKKGSFVTLKMQDMQGKAFPHAKLTFNGQASEGGVLKVLAKDLPADGKVKIGVIFDDKSVEPGFGDLFKLSRSNKFEGPILVQSNTASLDYINDQEVGAVSPLGWSAKLMVPLWKYWLFIFSIITLALLITWFLFLRPLMHPHFSGGEINFDWPQHQKIRLRGKRLVYLGGEKIIKQSLMSRIFTGKIVQYLKEEPYLIEIQPKRKGLRTEARLKSKSGINISPYSRGVMKDFEEFVIKQKEKKDVKFRFQKSR